MFYFNPNSIPPLLAGFLILSCGIYVWSKKINSTLNFSWFLFCLSMSIWLIGDFLLFITKDINSAVFYTKIVYTGVNGISLTAAYFCLKITKSKTRIFTKIAPLLYILSCFLVYKTNLIVDGVYKYRWGFYPRASHFHNIYLFLWLSIVYYSSIFLLIKSGDKRLKIEERKWFLYTFWIFISGGIIGTSDFLQKYGLDFYPFGYLTVPVMICLLTLGILKYQMLNINVAIKKSLLYSILIGILSSTYLFIILIIEALFKGILGYKSHNISILAAFIIAILFNPIRNRLQTFVDKLFLGKTPQEIAVENDLLRHELERSERLKAASTMALGLAHEIKNPLTTIKTFSEYIKEKHDDPDFIEKFSKLVPSEVERINNIVHRLLDFSKPAPPTFQNTNIARLIEETLEFLNNDFLKRHIVIEKTYEKDDLELKIDPFQIKQVLLNIILNAMDAMPKGGKLAIHTFFTPDNCLEIDIVDTGTGISKEHLKHIFDPFFTTKDSGSGLGLSIVHQIIENHKGKIEAESEMGMGTTFKIILKLR